MSAEISKEKMEEYRRSWRKRQERERQEMQARRQRAWMIARQAAELLRNRFGASKVVLFGSLARDDLFHERSDIDLAAWGIDERAYLKAVGQLLSIDPAIPVDLLRAEEAEQKLLNVVEREGIAI
jgi:predicted nucleotidyltransferase